MNFNSYYQNVSEWKKRWPPGITSICTFYGKCARCGKKAHHRHHKAHDYLFACVLPEKFAKDYVAFRAEDIDFLCKKCHKNAHKIYDALIAAFNVKLKKCKELGYTDDLLYKVCLDFKELFLQRYLKWRNWGKKK